MWACAGETLLVPFEPTDAQRRAGSVPARLSRGDALFAPLWWIGRTAAAPTPSRAVPDPTPGAAFLAARGSSWMDEKGRWSAVAATDTARRGTITSDGRWYLVIDLPPDAGGLELIIDGRRVPTGWISRAVATARPVGAAGDPGDGWIGAALDAARRDPFERWRARLAAGEPLTAVGPAADEFADRAVEALADQVGARWAQALRNVADEDASVADRLRRRLAMIGDVGGPRAPVWPVEPESLERLQNTLLNSPREAAVRAARNWLDAQPRAACWIANDAVMYDATNGRVVSRIAAISLDAGAEPEALMVRTGSTAAPMDVVRLPPLTVASGLFSIEPDASASAVVLAGIGRWTARRAVLARPIAAAPPGAPVGPLLREWTLVSWLEACTDAGDPRGGAVSAGLGRPPADGEPWTMGMLMADAPAATGAFDAASLRWTLYVECGLGTRAGADSTAREEIVLAISGAGGEAMVRVFADGAMVDSSGAAGRARVVRDARAWRVWVPIAPEVLAGGEWARLGLLRVDASGARTSWPRPVFPWEDRPPQAAIDLRAWTGAGR